MWVTTPADMEDFIRSLQERGGVGSADRHCGGVWFEFFWDGSAALNVGGFISVCTGALLIGMSILKMAPQGTKFEEASDLMQRGLGRSALRPYEREAGCGRSIIN